MLHYQQKGIIQQKFDETQLTCADARKQLDKDIDWENRRVNVDSSKKRAVQQHMDYDNFH